VPLPPYRRLGEGSQSYAAALSTWTLALTEVGRQGHSSQDTTRAARGTPRLRRFGSPS